MECLLQFQCDILDNIQMQKYFMHKFFINVTQCPQKINCIFYNIHLNENHGMGNRVYFFFFIVTFKEKFINFKYDIKIIIIMLPSIKSHFYDL